MMSRTVRSKGFTLIELLIVVAIIAILAAIAVPNFLEAQVRAKISRAKADMRSIATAIESYSVDNGKPNPAQNQGVGLTKIQSYALLTTPVAYMTGVPLDPFREKGARNDKSGSADNSINFYEYNGYWTQKVAPATKAFAAGYTWSLYSIGPSRNSGTGGTANILVGIVYPAPGQVIFHYDPTNGTSSQGYILRTNKGEFTGPSRYVDVNGNPI